MQLVKSRIDIIETPNILNQIERCGRICYKSEENIDWKNRDIAKSRQFVEDKVMTLGHKSISEHGTIYFYFNKGDAHKYHNGDYIDKGFLDVIYSSHTDLYNSVGEYISKREFVDRYGAIYGVTNFRVLLDSINRYNDPYHHRTSKQIIDHIMETGFIGSANGFGKGTVYISPFPFEPRHNIWNRISCNFTVSRAIGNEIIRHRVQSPSQESTRFCNYGSERLGNHVKFIIKPKWESYVNWNIPNVKINDINSLEIIKPKEEISDFNEDEYFAFTSDIHSMLEDEEDYLRKLKHGIKAQDARDSLGLFLKTELCETATIKQWTDFFRQRCSPENQIFWGGNGNSKPHHDLYPLADQLSDYIKDFICENKLENFIDIVTEQL